MNKQVIKTVLVVVALGVVLIQANQRTVEVVQVDDNNFCMYMDSYKSDTLGLLQCFSGDAHSVNSVNDELTERMRVEMPIISSNK